VLGKSGDKKKDLEKKGDSGNLQDSPRDVAEVCLCAK